MSIFGAIALDRPQKYMTSHLWGKMGKPFFAVRQLGLSNQGEYEMPSYFGSCRSLLFHREFDFLSLVIMVINPHGVIMWY